MPAAINYNVCDQAPECGGIPACPTKAFYWDKKLKKPAVDATKCISCGLCVPECPVGAIILARDIEGYRELLKRIKPDSKKEAELWRERLGTQPGRTKPLCVRVTEENFKQEVENAKGIVVLDVWSEATLDCRLHSVLWEDLKVGKGIVYKKLNGGKFPKLAKKLKVKIFPTLIILNNGKEVGRHEGYIYEKDRDKVRSKIVNAVASYSK